MAIFRNRPLAAACVVLILSAAGAFLLPFSFVLVFLSIAAVALIALIAWSIVRRMTGRKLLLLLLALALFLGTGRVLFDRYRARRLLGDRIGTEVSVVFVVEEIYSRSAYGSSLRVRVTELEGEPCRIRALLTTENLSPLYLGDTVSGRVNCADIAASCYYEGQESSYVADGMVATLEVSEESEPTLIKSGSGSFAARLSDFRYRLHHRLTEAVKGEKGELIGALLLGIRDPLENSTVRDFRRVGLSHLLALSGLHLSVLVGILDLFLRAVRLGKRPRICALFLFCIGYLFLTGCSFSMLRAVLMLCILQAAFFCKGDYDAFTALCFGGAAMVMMAPGAVFDLSFQMTMLATFGILAFGPLQTRLTRWIPACKGIRGILYRALRAVISSLLITLSATVAILPIQWLIFGEMSILTPLANLLMIPLTAPLLTLGLLMLALCAVPWLTAILGIPAGAIAELMLAVTSRLSPWEGMVSLRYDFVPFILIPLFLVTAVLLCVDLKKRAPLVLTPVAVAAIAFAVCLAVSNHMGSGKVEAVYRNVGKNEGLLLLRNGNAVLCDISNGSRTQLQEDYMLLQQHCATDIDVLLLTHYHERQIASLSDFSGMVMIRSLWLPEPQNDSDKEILVDLLRVAMQAELPVTIYAYDTPLTVFGAGEITVLAPLYEDRSVEPALWMDVLIGETSLTYQSGAYSEYARHAGKEEPHVADYLILGSHGPVPHEAVLPILAESPREIVIAHERILLCYEPLFDTRYVYLPAERTYVLK
ncbi:MAG: ComEC/Rec2 family competence protein [Clostridia bacterium]|nr:ComEC/Rec2 family competence protein [Clostridia bacterium]